jgi:hypothetical protein
MLLKVHSVCCVSFSCKEKFIDWNFDMNANLGALRERIYIGGLSRRTLKEI